MASNSPQNIRFGQNMDGNVQLKDMTGQKFGSLKVIHRNTDLKYKGKRAFWLCRCECGQTTTVDGSNLRVGNTTSCGCGKNRFLQQTTHGMSKDRIYTIWMSMKARCSNPKSVAFKQYGGRGINVCERWKKFENFYLDMCERIIKTQTLERVNNDGNYEPGNVQWASPKEQANNTRKVSQAIRIKTSRGLLRPREIAIIAGVSYNGILERIKNGETGDALLTPSRKPRKSTTS